MIIQRKIGKIDIEVETQESNEIYLPSETASNIKGNGIDDLLDFLYENNHENHIPLSSFIELTDICNFECPFCYINEPCMNHSSIPRFEVFKPIIDSLVSKGMIYCVLSGGECLLHKDFKEIYLYLKNNGVLVTIFSNGYLLNEDIINLFSSFKPFKVEISIYGYDDKTYEETTKRKINSFKIFSNILKLKNNGINVICKTPITNFTESSYTLIENWCKKNDIPYYSDVQLIDSYTGQSKQAYLATQVAIDSFEKSKEINLINDAKIEENITNMNKCKMNFDCPAGKTEVFITSKYELVPCMKAVNNSHWTFNIAELGFEKAYNSMVKKIDTIKNTPLKNCVGCKYSYFCQECSLTQYEYSNIEEHRKKYCSFLQNYMNNLLK